MAAIYCTIQDIRDEGITVAELSDARCLQLIEMWQDFIDNATGQFFNIRSDDINLDGDGSRMLLLPVPIVTCTGLYINDDFTTAIDTDQYVVYNSRGPIIDDRKNPHIMLKYQNYSVYTRTSGIFAIGDRNQRVVGDFGYVESDDSTPSLITRAVIVLVIATKELLGDDEIDQLKFGKVVEEVTDRHRIKYADLWYRIQAWNPTGLTDVDMALRMYKAPHKISAPRTMNTLRV